MRRDRVLALCFAFASVGCEPEAPPSESTGTWGITTTSSSGAESSAGPHATSDGGDATTGGDVCHGTSFCGGDGFCVAPYADNDRGAFDCVEACVGPDDEDHWCYDDAACCDPAASCTIRGYCVVPGEGSSSDGGSGSSDSGSSGSSSSGA